jgi:gas vesicle protein
MAALRSFIYAMSVVAASYSCAEARDFMDVIGVNSSIDHATDQMQALLDHAREAAFALELQTNNHAKERIEQIDKVVQDAIHDIQSVEDKTQADIDRILSKQLRALKSLETDTFAELSDTIEKAECAADKTANVYVQDMLGSFGRLIDTNTFELEAPPMFAGEQDCGIIRCDNVKKTFKINSADFAVTYRDLRQYLLDRLNSSRDDTPISSVLRSYYIIANTAKRAGCLTNLHQEYASEAAPYMAAIKTWEDVTGEPGVVVP